MKKKTSLRILGAMLFWTICALSCASLPLDLVPTLEHRTLRLSLLQPQAEYQYQVCVKKFLGICTKHQMQLDTYDLTDKSVREKLILMGFKLRVIKD